MNYRSFLQNEKQVSEYLTAIKGRKEIPLKFVYLEEGAYNWDRLIEDKKYGLGKIENDLLKSSLPNIYRAIGQRFFNLIDVGPGNGKKAVTFIRFFLNKFKPVYYLGLDISQEMLSLALRKLRSLQKRRVIASTEVVDFEQGNFSQATRKMRQEGYPRNVLFLLGNTIGNPFDKDRVLTNIRESMTLNDYLVIGLELADLSKIDQILKHYRQPALTRLIFFCLQNMGIKAGNGKLKVNFNKSKSQIEVFFHFKRSVEVNFKGEKFKYGIGDKVLLLISYKSDRSKMEKLLEKTGFHMNGFYTNRNKSYGLILCQPVRY